MQVFLIGLYSTLTKIFYNKIKNIRPWFGFIPNTSYSLAHLHVCLAFRGVNCRFTAEIVESFSHKLVLCEFNAAIALATKVVWMQARRLGARRQSLLAFFIQVQAPIFCVWSKSNGESAISGPTETFQHCVNCIWASWIKRHFIGLEALATSFILYVV